MAKTKLVTVKLPKETLSQFATDFEKKPASTPTKDNKKNPRPKKIVPSSPTPKSPEPEKPPAPTVKQNPPKAVAPSAQPTSSTANPSTSDSLNKKLDKSGAPVRKWSKKPLSIQSFTGYSITFKSWTGDAKANELGAEGEGNDGGVQFKLNNKNLDLGNDTELSGAPSPFPDDASSIVSTPDISRVPTPIPR